MLSGRVTRALCGKYTKRMTTGIRASINNARAYYRDPNSVDDLSKQIFLRRMLMSERALLSKEDKPEVVKVLVMKPFQFFSTEAPSRYSMDHIPLAEWWKMKIKSMRKRDQRYKPERQEILGLDLGAAHFALCHGGKIRFKGYPHWLTEWRVGEFDLPTAYDPNYILEGLILDKLNLEFGALLNISGLTQLKWLSVKGCNIIDDWALDAISAEYPSLEYLDISECKNVTERGLESLYRMPNLLKLIVTNHHKSTAFELTCYMLEDVNPYLKCEMRMPEDEPMDGDNST